MDVINFIYKYYYSILLCLVSLWLGITLIKANDIELAVAVVALAVIKLTGLIIDNNRLRKLGIIGLNTVWAVFVFYFLAGYHPPVELTFQFPLVILLIGVGISLRGRFDE